MTFERHKNSLVTNGIADEEALSLAIMARRAHAGTEGRLQLVHRDPHELSGLELVVNAVKSRCFPYYAKEPHISVPKHVVPAVHEGMVVAERTHRVAAYADPQLLIDGDISPQQYLERAEELLGKVDEVEALFPEFREDFSISRLNVDAV